MTAPSVHPGDDLAHGSAASRQAARTRALRFFGPVFDRVWPNAQRGSLLLPEGPALFVANHSGGCLAMLEPLLLAYRAGNPQHMPRLLLHEVMWHSPIGAQLRDLGALRASVENADRLLEQGESVLVYPGGDREVFRPFGQRDEVQLGDRRGYIRLALRHGVPLIPIVTSGLQSGFISLSDGSALAKRVPLAKRLRVGVLPVTLSFPFGLSVGLPAPYLPLTRDVSIRVLAPLHFTRSNVHDDAFVEACHREVVSVMQQALDALNAERRGARRGALHRLLDRLLDSLEAATGARHVAPPSLENAVRSANCASTVDSFERITAKRTRTLYEAPSHRRHRPTQRPAQRPGQRSGLHVRRHAS